MAKKSGGSHTVRMGGGSNFQSHGSGRSYQTHSYGLPKQHTLRLLQFPKIPQWNDEASSRGYQTKPDFEALMLQHIRDASQRFAVHIHAISDDFRPRRRACKDMAKNVG